MWILKSEIPKLFPDPKKWDKLDANFFDFIYTFGPLLEKGSTFKYGLKVISNADYLEMQLCYKTTTIVSLSNNSPTLTLILIAEIANDLIFPLEEYGEV